MSARWVAYDATTEWMGPVRRKLSLASSDSMRHNEGCRSQGGYGDAETYAVDAEGYLHTADGAIVWPPHGRSSGAVKVTQ